MDVHLVIAVVLLQLFACDLVRSHSCFLCEILVLCFSAVVPAHDFPLVFEGVEVPAGIEFRCCSTHIYGGRYWVRTSDLFRVREARYHCANRPSLCKEVKTGFEPVYTALQAAASPLGHSTVSKVDPLRADDETRTRDPHLGKVMRYQLRYIRIVLSNR